MFYNRRIRGIALSLDCCRLGEAGIEIKAFFVRPAHVAIRANSIPDSKWLPGLWSYHTRGVSSSESPCLCRTVVLPQ